MYSDSYKIEQIFEFLIKEKDSQPTVFESEEHFRITLGVVKPLYISFDRQVNGLVSKEYIIEHRIDDSYNRFYKITDRGLNLYDVLTDVKLFNRNLM
ncbi:MAG: hypothetical protein V4565_12115 [Bacteroidota bacterium]